jgi:predicted MFS family arabinose efflux permease
LLAWALTGLLPASTALTAAVMVLWGLGAFAFVSAQQARLSVTRMELASASIALNSSSLYAGQAMGAAAGGLLLAAFGFDVLAPGGLLLVLAALVLCVAADRSPR